MDTTPKHVAGLLPDEREQFERIACRFEDGWQRQPCHPRRVRAFLPTDPPRLRRAVLVELAVIDLERCLDDGQPARVEHYLDEFPELADDADAVGALLAVERARRGPEAPGALRECGRSLRATVKQGPTGGADWDVEMAAANSAPVIPGYEVLGPIGRGGMGVVYKARHVGLGRLVALKMVLAGPHADGDQLRRFHDEARAVARLQHPNIVQVFEVGSAGGLPYFSLEFVDGGSLADRTRREPQQPRFAAEIVETLARAMEYAHERGIVHRDLKPANVLLAKGGVPKITDFGVAKYVKRDAGHTRSGAILGTPAYMAPEQAAGQTTLIGPATDVYALGAMLYEFLTGRPPFQAAAVLDTLEHVRTQEPVPPRRLQPKLPRDLETICLKCLRKEPSRRYESAAALADDLRRFVDGRPIEARRVGLIERAALGARRRPAAAALSAVSGLALFSLTGLGVWHSIDTQLFNARLREEKRRADEQRDMARANEGKAREARRIADYRAYVSDMHLAPVRWEAGQVDLLLKLLDDHPPERTGGEDFRGFEWYYWHHTCHSDRRTLTGHTASVLGVAFSPDGKRLASASNDGTVRVWDADGGQELCVLNGHTGPVRSVAFSPDGTRLASAGDDGKVRVWGLTTSGAPLVLKGDDDCVTSVAFSPDGRRLASASLKVGMNTGTVRVWDTASGEKILTIRGRTAEGKSTAVIAVAFTPDSKRLASASEDGVVRVWDAAGGQALGVLTGHTARAVGVVFSPDGARVASAGNDGTVRLWDADSGRPTLVLVGPTAAAVHSVAFSPDGRRLASAGDDRAVRLWDATDGRQLSFFKGHTGSVYAVAFSPDGRRLASAGEDKTVKVWEADRAPGPTRLEGYRFEALPVAAASTVALLGLPQGQGPFPAASALAPGRFGFEVNRVAFSPDGRQLASAGDDRMVKVWDVDTGRKLLQLPGHQGKVYSVTYSPDGRRLASAAEDGTAKVWDADSGRPMLTFRGHTDKVWRAVFSPAGTRVASASEDRTVRIWDAETGKEVVPPKRHDSKVNDVAFSPDGKTLASAGWDHTVRVWDADTGRNTRTLTGHTTAVWCVAFSPDGRHLASGSNDKTVKVWDANTGEELRTLSGHSGEVSGVAYSRDGRRLASAGWDGTVRVWDPSTGQETLTLDGQTGRVFAVAFSPDGNRLAATSREGTVRIWSATPPEPVARR